MIIEKKTMCAPERHLVISSPAWQQPDSNVRTTVSRGSRLTTEGCQGAKGTETTAFLKRGRAWRGSGAAVWWRGARRPRARACCAARLEKKRAKATAATTVHTGSEQQVIGHQGAGRAAA